MSKLNLGEYKTYSADQLLKDKPKRLEGLEIVCNEKPDNYSIDINGITVFCKSYEIHYGACFVTIHFKDKYNNMVASISVAGSSEYKADEYFIVNYNGIISQTDLRVMNDIVKEAIN